MSTINNSIPSSFRDRNGFLFCKDGILYRQVRSCYQEHYDLLMASGLYKCLVENELLIPHEEIECSQFGPEDAYKIIKPKFVPFISYPYEWSFSQLKDAALLTLKIQKVAFDFGMCLKDCSAYNIQFLDGKPIFIDTLSFEKYIKGTPWIAYRQFCQHFLSPLALTSFKDVRLNQLSRIFIDGIPLELASPLLSKTTYMRFGILSHIHFHAKTQQHFAGKSTKTSNIKITKLSLQGLIDSLETTVKKLKWKPEGTEWADYYNDTNYSDDAFQHKKELISKYLDSTEPKTVWDLGANLGLFSRIASEKGIATLSFDIDPSAVEKNYLKVKNDEERNLLPLILDLTNPSPSIGWQNEERSSLVERGPVDMAFALALIHHLAISNNVPLRKIANLFGQICNALIIEFVPKTDSQVERLLLNREDIFSHYTQVGFEKEFGRYFQILEKESIKDSGRSLYLMKKQD